MKYGYTKEFSEPFDTVVEKVRSALAEEGFGVLTKIDVQSTLKEKIGAETEPYVILGACNPALAHKALQAEKEIGLLLPCNVIVYEDAGSVFVSAMLPTAAMSVVENEDVASVAAEVEQKLTRAVDAI